MTDIEGTAWKNSKQFPPRNSGYGIKINDVRDRRKFFPRGTVELRLNGFPRSAFANTDKKSFWEPRCGELINVEIGRWMRSLELIPWPDNDPPKFNLHQIAPNVFEVGLARR